MSDPYHRFALAKFETLNLEAANPDRLNQLKQDLEQELITHMQVLPGGEGLIQVISGLNRNGHQLKQQPSDSRQVLFAQETNQGTREFWIHTLQNDYLLTVDVIYRLKPIQNQTITSLETGGQEPSLSEIEESFYERGLQLCQEDASYESLPLCDRIHLALYLLDTGVNSGGFRTYLFNTEGAFLADTAQYLETVGAQELAAVVKNVLPLFPSGLEKAQERWQRIEAKSEVLNELDKAYGGTTENLAELFRRYRSQHP